MLMCVFDREPDTADWSLVALWRRHGWLLGLAANHSPCYEGAMRKVLIELQ
jgi:hypothetical protein